MQNLSPVVWQYELEQPGDHAARSFVQFAVGAVAQHSGTSLNHGPCGKASRVGSTNQNNKEIPDLRPDGSVQRHFPKSFRRRLVGPDAIAQKNVEEPLLRAGSAARVRHSAARSRLNAARGKLPVATGAHGKSASAHIPERFIQRSGQRVCVFGAQRHELHGD